MSNQRIMIIEDDNVMAMLVADHLHARNRHP
jgi:hypothetical protein